MTLGPFEDLPEAERRRLTELAVERTWAPGETIYRQGDEADRLYVVQAGIVGVHARTPGGGEALISLLGPESSFGELTLAGAPRRTATIVAIKETRTLSVAHDVLTAMRRRSREVDEAVLTVLADIILGLTARLVEARTTTQPERLRRLLLELHRLYAPGHIELSQQQLAELIGARRTTVSELLAAEAPHVRTGRGWIDVRHPDALRARDPV